MSYENYCKLHVHADAFVNMCSNIKDLLGFLFWDRLVILFSFNFTDQGLHVEQLPVFHWISRGTGVWDNNLTIGTFVAQKKKT